MTYTANNVDTFAAAMAGALSGIGIGERPITSTITTDYAGLALAAFAFAEEFDTLWGGSAPDELEVFAILTASCNYFENRNKLSQTASVYEHEVAAIIAAIREGDAICIEGGVTPRAWPPGGGGGTVTDVTGTSPIVITGSPTTAPNVTILPATDSAAGSLSAADKTKLDNITTVVTSVTVTSPITNSGSSTAPDIGLAASGTPTGTFGDGTHVATITVDAQGIITNVVSTPITSGGAGTVTDVTGTAPIVITGSPTATPNVTITAATDSAAGSMSAADKTKLDAITTIVTSVGVTAPITNTGTATAPVIGHAVSGVTAGTEGDATHVAQVTVNADGHVTALTNVAITFPVTGVTVTAPIANTGSASAPDIALITPSYFWQQNPGVINLTSAPQTVASVTITPAVTGKFFVTVNAQVENSDSSNIHEIIWEITNTENANTYSPFPTNIGIGQGGNPFVAEAGFNVALDLGSTPAGSVFTVGTPVTLHLVAAADTNTGLSIQINALQVSWQERYA